MKPFALVEMFTSENSVHAKTVAELAQSIDQRLSQSAEAIHLLVYHVDYLNTPAWKDRQSSRVFSERHLSYSKAFGQRSATPGQVIINGQLSALAIQRVAVDRKIKRALSTPARASLRLTSELAPDASVITVRFVVKGLERVRREFFYFHAALTENGTESRVEHGPNMGERFSYVATVRVLGTSRFNAKKGTGTIEVGIPSTMKRSEGALVCFVQDPRNQRVLGAKRIMLSSLLGGHRSAK